MKGLRQMDRHKDVESLAEVFHKEKNQKKTTVISPIVNSLLDSSPIVKGTTTVKSLSEQITDHQNRHLINGQKKLHQREKLSKQTLNVEIDACLNSWVMEGLVDPAYLKWVAKCAHTLGIDLVNRIAINARDGDNPQRLFSSLLKGNMNLKAKLDYYDVTTVSSGTAAELKQATEN